MADGKLFVRSYTWTKSVLQQRGLVTKAAKRSAHRKKRARRPLPGMLVFQDGSKHAWLPQGPALDLIVTMDDATSAILSAVLVEEEGTASSFIGLKETIAGQGLFCALYTDRGSHYFITPKAGEAVDKERLTQVGRALDVLGIEQSVRDRIRVPEGVLAHTAEVDVELPRRQPVCLGEVVDPDLHVLEP